MNIKYAIYYYKQNFIGFRNQELKLAADSQMIMLSGTKPVGYMEKIKQLSIPLFNLLYTFKYYDQYTEFYF